MDRVINNQTKVASKGVDKTDNQTSSLNISLIKNKLFPTNFGLSNQQS
jgi:hypothetical protein